MLKNIFERKEHPMQEIIITLKIEKQRPLALQNLSAAILSLNRSMGSFVGQDKKMGDMELQLKSVEKGSDIFNFLVMMPSLLPPKECIESINSYFELWRNVKNIKLKSVQEIQNEKYIDKTMAKDISNIINLNDIGANASITNSFNDAQIIINNNTFMEYRDGIDCIAKIKGFDEKIEAKSIFQNKLIEFYQTTNTQKDLKHKAFCYDIDKNAKGIFIDDERLKNEMIENPYNYRFLVDLEVYKDRQGRITTYRAFNYKGKIQIDKLA